MSTILVVEDESSVRALVSTVLKSAGHIVVLASNGLEGISLFRSSPKSFDLVLTDLKMPLLDGHQLVKLIRETSFKTRIMCMSGFTDKPLPAGVEFLKKPFLPSALRTRVAELLRRD